MARRVRTHQVIAVAWLVGISLAATASAQPVFELSRDTVGEQISVGGPEDRDNDTVELRNLTDQQLSFDSIYGFSDTVADLSYLTAQSHSI